MKRRLQSLVDAGKYDSITDAAEFALHYLVERDTLRQDVYTKVIADMDSRIDEVLKDRLYSDENSEFLFKIVEEVSRKIIDEKFHEDK